MRNLLGIVSIAFVLYGCASSQQDKALDDQAFPTGQTTMPLQGEFDQDSLYRAKPLPARIGANELDIELGERQSSVERRLVPTTQSNRQNSQSQEDYPVFGQKKLTVTLPEQTLPEFAATVFGDLLGMGLVLGKSLENNTDIISPRSTPNMSEEELFLFGLSALSEYGVGAYYENDVLYVMPYPDLKRTVPRFITARARASVPVGLRPVVQYIKLTSADANQLSTMIKEHFSADQISIQINRGQNALTISGLPVDVDAVLDIIDVIDVPQFAGSEVITYRPENWSADELVEQIVHILTVEGYSVSTQPTLARNITLLPIPYTNQISIFVKDEKVRRHVFESVLRLDRDAKPLKNQNVSDTHIYKAKFYDAEKLAQIVDSVLASMRNQAAPSQGVANTNLGNAGIGQSQISLGGGAAERNVSLSGRVIVEKQGNRIVFFGTSEEYRSIHNLLETIDTPADEVLLEVTIAEVTLNEETKTGLEFLFEQLGSKGYAIGTQGGIGLATGGLTGSVTSGDYSLNFGALATNTQINVLSEPRIVTKSGSAASINVGNEVPIITSQRASNSQSSGSTDVLQSVQYRSTGILLDIEPIVFSNYRIDLTISQEVSSAEANPNQAIASPIISNRSLSTELSLRDGQSAILGGLIETRFTRGQNGVPFMKDLPVLGRAFKTDSLKNDKTMLLIMVTPYILREPEEKLRKLDEVRSTINSEFHTNMYDSATTLYGPREQLEVGGTGVSP